ncbi:MAG: tetratricopeptide repeat protein, partial [bacterium]
MAIEPGSPDDPTVDMPADDGSSDRFRSPGRPGGPNDTAPTADYSGVIDGRDAETRAAGMAVGGSGRCRGQRVAGFELIDRVDKDAGNAFGEVWLARRLEPFQRVAIKFLRRDRVNDELVRRFSCAESKALARFNHPYIARFYELGFDGDTPYLVMQFVPGDRITSYCDTHGLSIAARLHLMAKLCDAVQHVHLQGVVHRDLKPGNILVSETRPDAEDARDTNEDGDARGATSTGREPIPVLIDFGLAKSVNPDAPLASVVMSRIGRFAGTYAYASPEQIAQRRDEETGREADIYALGAVLFELIAGISPMEHVLSDDTLSDPERTMRLAKDERPGMSQAFALLSRERQEEIAKARGTTVEVMKRLLRSRLVHLTDRALRTKPANRFRDARAFGLDIANYLADRDFVEAAAEPRIEKWRRTVRRNRVAFTGVAGVIVALTAGVAATAWQWRQAVAAREAEEERSKQLRRISEFQSQMLTRLDAAMVGSELMQDVCERFDTSLAKAKVDESARAQRVDVLRRELEQINATDAAAAMIDRTILRPAIDAIDAQFGDDPLTGAALRESIATLYRTLGLYQSALPLQEAALDSHRRVLGSEHIKTIVSLSDMGLLLEKLDREPEALAYAMESLEKSRRLFGDRGPQTIVSLANMAVLRQAEGKLVEAEALCREAYENARVAFGEDDARTLSLLDNLGQVLQGRGSFAEAESIFRDTFARSRRLLGDVHEQTIDSMNNLGLILHAQGRFAEAEPLYRSVLEIRRDVRGEDHPLTLLSMSNLGGFLRERGNLAGAEVVFREALEGKRRVLGPRHPDTLFTIADLGSLLLESNKLAEAEPFLREGLEELGRAVGDGRLETLVCMNNMAVLRKRQGQLAEAEQHARGAYEGFVRSFGDTHEQTQRSLGTLCSVLVAQQNYVAAEQHCRELIRVRRKTLGDTNARTLDAIYALGSVLRSRGMLIEA